MQDTSRRSSHSLCVGKTSKMMRHTSTLRITQNRRRRCASPCVVSVIQCVSLSHFFRGKYFCEFSRKTVRRKELRSHTDGKTRTFRDSCHMSPFGPSLSLFFLLLPTFTHKQHTLASFRLPPHHLNRTRSKSIITASQHPVHPPHACGSPPPAPPSPLTSIAGMCSAAMPRLVHTVEWWTFQAGQRCGALMKHK